MDRKPVNSSPAISVLVMQKRVGAAHTADRPNWALAPDEPPVQKARASRQPRQRGRGSGLVTNVPTSRNREHSRGRRSRRGSDASGSAQARSPAPARSALVPVVASVPTESAPSVVKYGAEEKTSADSSSAPDKPAASSTTATQVPISSVMPPETVASAYIAAPLVKSTTDEKTPAALPMAEGKSVMFSLEAINKNAAKELQYHQDSRPVGAQITGCLQSREDIVPSARVTVSVDEPQPVKVPRMIEELQPPRTSQRLTQLQSVNELTLVEERRFAPRSAACEGQQVAAEPQDGPDEWLGRAKSWIGHTPSRAYPIDSMSSSAEAPLLPVHSTTPYNVTASSTSSDALRSPTELPSRGLNRNAPVWEPRTRASTTVSSEGLTSPNRSAAPSPGMSPFAYGIDADIENLRRMLRNCGLQESDAAVSVGGRASPSWPTVVTPAGARATTENESAIAQGRGPATNLPAQSAVRPEPDLPLSVNMQPHRCQQGGEHIPSVRPSLPQLHCPSFVPFPENITRHPIRPCYDLKGSPQGLAEPVALFGSPDKSRPSLRARSSTSLRDVGASCGSTQFSTPSRAPFAGTPQRDFRSPPELSPSPVFPGSYTLSFVTRPTSNVQRPPTGPHGTPFSKRSRQPTSGPGQQSQGWLP